MDKSKLKQLFPVAALFGLGGVVSAAVLKGDLNYILSFNPAEARAVRLLEIVASGDYPAL